MKKTSYSSIDADINFVFFFKELLKKKFLILVVTIIFGLFGYIYTTYFFKNYLKSIILLRNVETNIDIFSFSKMINIVDTNYKLDVELKDELQSKLFYKEFYVNLSSSDNLANFLQQSKDYDLFKKYLKLNNTTGKHFFSENKFGVVEQKKINLLKGDTEDKVIKFFLIFPKELDGVTFLEDYVKYTNNKTLNFFKKDIKISLEYQVLRLESALKIAKILNIENPILISDKSDNQSPKLVNEPNSLIFFGSKVLSYNLNFIKDSLYDLENFQSNFDIIIDKPSKPISVVRNSLYVLVGSTLGFILSLLIIFIKKINYK